MIRACNSDDLAAIEAIINEAAEAYRGIIPSDCWHEPYMPRATLAGEIAAGVMFSGWTDKSGLVGVMGRQQVRDATLIRHAYVRPSRQRRGIGSALLAAVADATGTRLMVGTWAAADWAIRFYQQHGFRPVSPAETQRLLETYWRVPRRQQESSVVLVR